MCEAKEESVGWVSEDDKVSDCDGMTWKGAAAAV